MLRLPVEQHVVPRAGVDGHGAVCCHADRGRLAAEARRAPRLGAVEPRGEEETLPAVGPRDACQLDCRGDPPFPGFGCDPELGPIAQVELGYWCLGVVEHPVDGDSPAPIPTQFCLEGSSQIADPGRRLTTQFEVVDPSIVPHLGAQPRAHSNIPRGVVASSSAASSAASSASLLASSSA